jgi:hypothetical protein
MNTNSERAQTIGEAMRKLREASELLREVEYEPRLGSCIRELEGCGLGWQPPDESEDLYLFDRLFDHYLEAGGDPQAIAETLS